MERGLARVPCYGIEGGGWLRSQLREVNRVTPLFRFEKWLILYDVAFCVWKICSRLLPYLLTESDYESDSESRCNFSNQRCLDILTECFKRAKMEETQVYSKKK